MAALVHAKTVNRKKTWYVWGTNGREKWVKEYPTVRTRSELCIILAAELGLSTAASSKEVVFALMNKTWNGSEWIDDFSIRLRQLREASGYTQARLAEEAALSIQGIAALEQGTRGPTWDTARRLADALKVGVEQFRLVLVPEPSESGLATETS